ncbi:ankyrin [Tuber magnatum]|uniref:Ankyrin n=1 Tax=Tuber magnatum TaxID=42249 RepID=A0A317SH93_9PEZI|nr:ankyrin [Tuber magnatum]
MSFLHFPDELVVEVGKNLAPTDLYHLALTNGRMERIFIDDLPNTVFEDRPRVAEFGAKLIWFYAHRGDKEKVVALVQKGILQVVGPTFLHEGIPNQSLDALREVIGYGIGLKNLDPQGFSPLALAVAAGRADVVAVLAAHRKVDINYRHPTRNWTAMHLACLWKHPGVLRSLVENSTPFLAASDPDWRVALEIANRSEEQQMCVARALLASYKLDVNASVDGYTALHFAVVTTQWKGLHLLESLLQDGRTDLNPRDTFGRTPLNIAAGSGAYDAVEVLLSHGADVNMPSHPVGPDGKRWSPLHSAAHRGYEGVVRLLTSHPLINLNQRGALNETALDLALRASHVAVANILLSTKGIQTPIVCFNRDGSYIFTAPYSDDIKWLLLNYLKGEKAETESVDEWA